jgi:hypothetical protein
VSGRPRRHTDRAAKQAAWRRQQAFKKLAALQETQAPLHIVAHGKTPHLQPSATEEQRALQADMKERDMADALWTLQTLIADYGYAEVEAYVLTYVRPRSASRG